MRGHLPWTDLSTVSRDDFVERFDLLNVVSAQASIFDRRATHPWRGFSATAVTISDREQIEQDLQTILGTSGRVQDLIPHLQAVVVAEDFSIEDLTRLQSAFASIATLDRLPQNWFASNVEQLEQKVTFFETAARIQRDFGAQFAIYNQHFDLPLEQAGPLLLPAVLQFSKRYQRILPSYWKWRSGVRGKTRHGTTVTHATAIRIHAVVRRLMEIDKWFVNQQAELSVESPNIRDMESLTEAANRYRAAATLVGAVLTTGKQPAKQAEISDAFREAAREIPAILSDALPQAMERLDRGWPMGFAGGSSTRSATTKALANRTSELLGALSLIQEWVALQRTLQRCDSASLTPFVSALGTESARPASSVRAPLLPAMDK